MIGKASPELIGKEIEIRPEGVFLEGKKLDLAEIGLPELELDSMTGRQEMHPAQLRCSMNALGLYRRARRALIAGKRLVLQAGMAATEVVQAWRREFEGRPEGVKTPFSAVAKRARRVPGYSG